MIVRSTLRRSSLREFGWLSISNQLGVVFTLLTMLVLVRVESVTVVGQVVFAQAIASVTMLLVDIRFEDAIQRYFPLVQRDRGEAEAAAFFWRLCRWDLGLGAVIAAVTVLAAVFEWLPSSGSWVPAFLVIALLTAGVSTVLGSLNSGFAVTGRLTQLARVSTGATLLGFVCALVGVAVGGGAGYLVGQLVGTTVQVGLAAWIVRRYIRPVSSLPVASLPAGLGQFLVKSSSASSLAAGTEPGVLAIGGALATPEFVALLKVAHAPARVLTTLFSPLAVQAFPRLGRMAAVGDGAGIRRLLGFITTRAAAVAVLAAAAAYPLMEPTLGILYGDGYTGVWLAAVLLVAAAGARGVVIWSKVLPLAIGRPGLRLVIMTVESAVLVGSTVWVTASVANDDDAVTWFAVAATALAGAMLVFWLSIARATPRLVQGAQKGEI